MSKLTILFPVYNSITRNGDGFIQQALDSLINQTFKDFEIHILDNISDDSTPDICKKYAEKDKRIKFKIDTKQRFPEDGINELAKNVHSKYLMIANCDDLWNHHYIEILYKFIQKNPEVDTVYSNGCLIDTDNHIINPLVPNTQFTYNNDIELNFCLGIQHRNVVPILFGIFKTESYQKTLPFEAFDNLKANSDNLFLMKFFLKGYRAQLCNEELFYYRSRNRSLDLSKFPDIPKSPILIWIYYIIHQFNFYTAVSKYIPEHTPLLKLAAFDSCLRHIGSLLLWVMRDFQSDRFEINVLRTLYERYGTIQKMLFANAYPDFTEDLCKESCKKSRVFRNYILYYVCEVMRPHKILEDVIIKINEINDEIENILKGFPSKYDTAINE